MSEKIEILNEKDMASTELIVSVGNDSKTTLAVYRRYKHSELDAENKMTKFYYEEYYLVNGEKVQKEEGKNKYYVIRNVLAGEDPNDEGPLEQDFLGFDILENFNIGALPDPTPASYLKQLTIKPRLESLRIGVESGYVITS